MILSSWNGLERGDPVKVEGAGRGATFTFRGALTDHVGMVTAVEVMGARPGRAPAFRTFEVGRVHPIRPKGPRRGSRANPAPEGSPGGCDTTRLPDGV